jgi:thiol:disulfide interchange protein DsbA
MQYRAALLMLALVAIAACSNNAPAPASSAPAESPPPAAATPASAATTPVAAQPSAGENPDVDTTASNSQSSLERTAPLPAAGSLPAGRWVVGTHYRPLVPAQPTNVSPGKVEVVEVFWYGCSHCYAFDPFLESWRKNLPPNIEFTRLPVMWSATHRAHAHLFYTLQALGKLEALHSKVFNEIQVKNNPLAGSDDAATLKLQVAFAVANGISESDYTNAFKSFSVQTRLQQAQDLTTRYKVEGVPLVVINGKYVSDVGMAGGQANLISLINDLAAAEKRR